VWFCNRECQVLAARQGHSGANCRPADGVRTITAADAEVAPRVPDAAGPSTTVQGVDSASLAPAANACHTCGKSDAKLLRCGRCLGVWFCNRECQNVARQELGHRGANCRPADGAQKPGSAPSQPSTPMDVAQLYQRFWDLSAEANQAHKANTRIGNLAAVEKATEAASVADLIGGAAGANLRTGVDRLLVSCLVCLGNMAAAARAVCSSLRAARTTGNRKFTIRALIVCSSVANLAPAEMVKAEMESRKQERLSSSPSYGGPDLSQEGRTSLPTTPAALSRLDVTYIEAAVDACDAALTAAGGRGSPAANDERRVPSLCDEANARASLGVSLHSLGERQRGLELFRQGLALLRRAVREAPPGHDALQAKQSLAYLLSQLWGLVNLGVGNSRNAPGFVRMAEAGACLREALELCEESDDVMDKQRILRHLANLSGRPDQPVGLAEAAALRSRLNALYAQAGRSTDTSCTICLEPLEMPAGDVENGAADDNGRDADGYTNCSVLVLICGHQFHRGCLSTWWRTRSDRKCPLCKK